MIEVVQSIFGQYHLIDGKTNWEYIAAVVIFCIVLWSACRIVGMVFGK